MIQIKKTILTLVALIAVTTGAWAQTGENIFQYCYDCQRSPAYPKTTASASLSGFANPLVGYKGSGFGMDNTSAGPWKLEYVGLWSTTDKHGIDDYSVSNYQSTYNCTDVPVFRLYQWNATANEYQHAAYGVVCSYAKVSNAVEHTALFVAQGGWGCVLTNSSHSSSMNITFDEDLSTGLTTLIAAATPNASSGTAFDLTWDATAKTATIAAMPAGNVIVEPEYFAVAEFTDGGAPTGIADIKATTDDDIVKAGTVKNIGSSTTPQGTVMYYAVQSATAPTAPDYDATGWTDKVPTATGFDEGNVYVWYYVKGADGDETSTFSDGAITKLGESGYITLLAAPTYAVTFADDLAEPDKWTASPATDVTKGQPVTVTYTGSKKVLGVKAEKKAAAVSLIVNPVVGQVIGSDGKNYDANATLPTGVTAVAKIFYVGSETGVEGYTHGLALALTDEASAMNWTTATGASGAAAHTPAAPTTTSSWMLPSKDQWEKMITAAGGFTALRDGFSGISGASNMPSGAYYWSSTEYDAGKAWDFKSDQGNWFNSDKSYSDGVRACLAF